MFRQAAACPTNFWERAYPSMPTAFALTYGAGDWATWLFLAFASGLVAAFIARPQGAGCFGFGCFGNLLIGGIGVIVGNLIVGWFYSGTVNVAAAFAISLLGALLILYAGQAVDRLLRRNAPPAVVEPPQRSLPTVI